MVESLNDIIKLSDDYKMRCIVVDHMNVSILFNETLSNNIIISDLIYYIISKINKKNVHNVVQLLPYSNVHIIEYNDIVHSINNGFVVVFLNNKYYSIEAKPSIDRGVPSIGSELSLYGAKDSFSENIFTNVGLIRKRIKNNLCNISINVGTITKTQINILYIRSVCKMELVEQIVNKLKQVDIDGILDSSYLKRSLEGSSHINPTIMMSERPDKCSMALLEGKVVILVDNSPYALILPSFFIDFFHTPDDYYQKSIHTSFIRIIRLLAFLIAIYTPAIYLSVTTRNYNLISLSLLLTLKAGRNLVPFPAYLEAMLMMIAFEILKEGDLRKSNASNSSISILGGLILGDAAVAAGIVSPIMIIVIAISSISSLIFSSNELTNMIRFYQWLLLILSTLFGIYGVFIGTLILFISLYHTKSFGFHYIYIDKNEFFDSFLKINRRIEKRNSKLTNNQIRGRL